MRTGGALDAALPVDTLAPSETGARALGLLDGKVAVVTWAASTMGRLVARIAVAEGARIVVADADSDAIGALIGSLGHNYADGVVCDFSDDAQVADMVGLAVRRFGRLDAAFNATYDSGLSTAVMEKAMALCVRHEAEHLITQARGGAIINFHAADRPADENRASGPIALSGLDALVKAAGIVFGPRNIRINTVGCGTVAEALTAARIAVYLASDEASGISGEVFDAADDVAIQRYPSLARSLSQLRE